MKFNPLIDNEIARNVRYRSEASYVIANAVMCKTLIRYYDYDVIGIFKKFSGVLCSFMFSK